MVKKNKIVLVSLFAVVLLSFLAYMVFADILTTKPASFSFNEDSSNLYNITVNNTDGILNFTQINITFPANFSFTTATNGTSALNVNYTRDGNVTSWTNSSLIAVPGINSTNMSFWVNGTLSAPGSYSIIVTTLDSSGKTNTTTIPITIADVTKPVITVYSPLNSTYATTNITVNFTASDNVALSATGPYWFNNGSVNTNITSNSTTTTALQGTNLFIFFANDSTGNVAYLTNVTFFVDSIYPAINYTSQTDGNGSVKNRGYILANITFSDTNLVNMTINLYNSSGLVNATKNSTPLSFYENVSGLKDGVYYLNASAYDTAGNINNTIETRVITLDTTAPTEALTSPSNNTLTAAAAQTFSVTVTDAAALKNVTFNLWYSNGTLINQTNVSVSGISNSTSVPFTLPSDGAYLWNYQACDSMGDCAFNETNYTITLDTTAPTITLISPADGTSSDTNTYDFIFNVTDASSVSSCTLIMNNIATLSLTSNINNTGGNNTIHNAGLANRNYAWNVNCTDVVLNTGNSSSRSLTVGSSSSNNPGGSSNNAATSGVQGNTWKKDYIYNASEFKNLGQFRKTLVGNERVKLRVNGTDHYVGIKNITGGKVKIEVASTPQQFTLGAGESQKVDVNNDGYYDININVLSVSTNSSEITLDSINEKVVTAAPPAETPAQQNETAPATPTTGNNYTLWIVIGVIVVILIIIWIVMASRKGEKADTAELQPLKQKSRK